MTTMIQLASPLGTVHVLGTADAITGIYLPGQGMPVAPIGDTPVLREAARQLAEYFARARITFDLPLAPDGTEFQQLVWRALTAIPYGRTCSYGELAHAIARPAASRAVGAANGKNPLAIVVPCHRVIGASGALTGYAGGIAAKRWLLAHEQQHVLGNAVASC